VEVKRSLEQQRARRVLSPGGGLKDDDDDDACDCLQRCQMVRRSYVLSSSEADGGVPVGAGDKCQGMT
jgi:hypothetical protein